MLRKFHGHSDNFKRYVRCLSFPPTSGSGSGPDGLALNLSCAGPEVSLAQLPGPLPGGVFCFGDQCLSIGRANAVRVLLYKWGLCVNSYWSNYRNEQTLRRLHIYCKFNGGSN